MHNTFLRFLLLISFSASSVAEKTIDEHKTIEVVGLPIPPYIIVENDNTSGILVDVLRLVFKELDMSVTFKISNWARSYSQIRVDATDAIIPALYSVDRTEYLAYPSTPLLNFNMVLAGHSERPYNYDGNLKQLAPYTIGRIRNAKVSPEFDEAVAQNLLTIKERNNIDLLVAAIVRKRLDLAVMEHRAIEWSALQSEQREQVKILQPPLSKLPVYIAFNKNRVNKDVIDKVNAVLLKLSESGKIKQIIDGYQQEK